MVGGTIVGVAHGKMTVLMNVEDGDQNLTVRAVHGGNRPVPGDKVWWQGDKVYWTPKNFPEKQDIAMDRVGKSH